MATSRGSEEPAWFDDTPVYHEQQAAALCGRHALNNLLQGPYITEVFLSEIAAELDEREREVMLAEGHTPEALRFLAEGSTNVDDSGNFSITVLREALRRVHDIALDCTPESVARALADPNDADAYVLNLQAHWFAIRRLHTMGGKRWFNLNSLLKAPEVISDFYLAAFLSQMKEEGYSIFVVRGSLPATMTDMSTAPAACWHRVGDILRAQATSGPAARAAARQRAADRARQEAEYDPQFAGKCTPCGAFASLRVTTLHVDATARAAALRASMADSGLSPRDIDSGRGFGSTQRQSSAGLTEDELLQIAMAESLREAPAPSRAFTVAAQPDAQDDEELQAALALSLTGMTGAGASVTPDVEIVESTPALSRPTRADLPPEPDAAAQSVRLQLRIAVPATMSLPPTATIANRKFANTAPVSDVRKWASVELSERVPSAKPDGFKLMWGFPPVALEDDRKGTVQEVFGSSAALTLTVA